MDLLFFISLLIYKNYHQFLKERIVFNYEVTGLYLGFFGSIILDRFNMIIDNTPKLIEQ